MRRSGGDGVEVMKWSGGGNEVEEVMRWSGGGNEVEWRR